MILEKIRKAGFSVRLDDVGSLLVSPPDKLTEAQRAYLKAQEPQIVAALQAEATGPLNDAIALTREVFGDVTVTTETEEPRQEFLADSWTPQGEPIRVRCESAKHVRWVENVNPPRTIGITEQAHSVLKAIRYLITKGEKVMPQLLANHIPLSGEETIGALSELERMRYVHPGNWEKGDALVRLSRSGVVWVIPGGRKEKSFAWGTEPAQGDAHRKVVHFKRMLARDLLRS
jgi:hypothetical protein